MVTQKELTESIREGLNQSRNDFSRQFLKAFIFVIIIGLFLLLFNAFHTARENRELCGKIDCPVSMAPQSCFPLNNLHCIVSNLDEEKYACSKDGYYKIITTREIMGELMKKGWACGGPNNGVFSEKDICGYQEANSWLEQIKENNEGNFILECN